MPIDFGTHMGSDTPTAVSSVLHTSNTSPHPERWPTCFARGGCQHAAGVLGKACNARVTLADLDTPLSPKRSGLESRWRSAA